MEPEKKTISGIPISGALVIIALIVGLVVIPQLPYKPSRHKAPEKIKSTLHEGEDVQARLWQDPFAAAIKHKRDIKPNSKKHGINSLKKQIIDKIKDSIVVLGVMVPGGPYAEDTESRKRYRYAVLSALGELEYVPEDSEHIGYVCCEIHNNKKSRPPGLIPYEWFESERSQKKPVLVLWLNDSSFSDTPLRKFSHLTGELKKAVINNPQASKHNKPELKFKILGPASSTNLKDIIKEEPLCEKQSELLSNVQIFSWAATVDPDTLLREKACDKIPAKSVNQFIEDKCLNKNQKTLTFFRTIGTDKTLTDLLAKELALRIRQLIPKQSSGKSKVQGKGVHIALISEWDTFYGRNLPQTFKKSMADTTALIYPFSYMRGLDGQIPGEAKTETPASDSANKNETKTEEEDIERPVGRNQFDYLRRLALRLKDLDTEIIKYRKGKGIQAIGIMGTDVYDKLIILQAMYKLFPDAIFFTTDLDARLLHPGELKWTRNLIIASNFGLHLNEYLQKNTPPFRDNYQTSLFLSTKIAFSECKNMPVKKNDWFDCPRIFEVGRSGAFGLRTGEEKFETVKNVCQMSKTSNAGIHPPPQEHSSVWMHSVFPWYCLLTTLSFLLVFRKCYNRIWKDERDGISADHQAYSYSLRLLFGFLIFLMLAIILIITSQYKEVEPFAFFEGISIWPTEFLRFLAGVTSLYFLTTGSFKAYLTDQQLDKEFFNPYSDKTDAEKGSASAKGETNWPVKVSSVWKEVRKVFSIIKNKVSIKFFKPESKQADGEKGDEPGKSDTDRDKMAASVWKDYVKHTALGKRWLRILPLVFFYYITCCLIIETYGQPFVPFRGRDSYLVDFVSIRFFAVPLFILLITWVVDSTMSVRWLIHRLAQTELIWPEETVHKISNKFNIDSLCENVCVNEWLSIQAIVKISETVSRFVYYPFIVILILCASRLQYFDKWDTSIGLLIVIMLALAYSLYCAVSLRRSAQKARETILDKLWEHQVNAIGHKNKDLAEQIKMIYDAVESIKKGAFVSFFEQPWVRAFLLFIGGGGSLLALDSLPF